MLRLLYIFWSVKKMVWIRFPVPMMRLGFVWGKPRWPLALDNVELYYVAEFCGVMYCWGVVVLVVFIFVTLFLMLCA